MNFKKSSTLLGWLTLLVGVLTYAFTMERTGSLWDCGEFLSCTYKLQVAHPPGAPFYMIVGKLFSLLAMGDTTKVAMMINLLSAVSGAFCSFFFFHSSVILLKLVTKTSNEDIEGSWGTFILIASFIGANAATFLDSMWFNAIEGEVYSFSIFFTTFNVWAILRWYDSDSPKADYWLLLIGLCTGMSIGVHLLSLLVFPMMAVLIYYKKSTKTTTLGTFLAFLAGVGLIFFVMKLMLSYTTYFIGRLDLVFVNTFGLPFFTGSIVAIGLILFLFYFLIRKSSEDRNFFRWNESKMKFPLNTVILFFAFLFMGYTSYFMVLIRANANLPINMNVPNNFLTLQSYIDREQYGDRPLLFGPHYYDANEIEAIDETSDIYVKNLKTNRYELVGKNRKYVYPSKVKKFFPRVGHEAEDKKDFYRMWIQPKYDVIDRATGNVVQSFGKNEAEQAEQTANQMNTNGQPQYVVKDKVSFFDNISYMMRYQIGFMYFRYLMWNTAGKVDDLQGRITNDYGRWTSGINVLDNFLGDTWGNVILDQSNRPQVSQMSKAHNKFYMIPFILCVLGMIYSYKKDRKMFIVLLVLVITTGIMQLIQHNEPPVEPRERDYGVAPSFWAFVLWLPFGIVFLYELIKSKLSVKPAMIVALVIGFAAPILMGTQGWDDHNRSNRSTTLAFAKNMLNACPPNAILFCYGDNDTYPLWYAQEVEGIRTDVRVINTSLIEGDAYISQLRLPMNESKAVKLSIPQEKITGDKRSYLRFSQTPLAADTMSLKDWMDFIMSDDERAKVRMGGMGQSENFIPTTNVYIDIDAEKAKRAGFLITKDKMNSIPNRVYLQLPGNMSRGSIIQLDVLLNNLYERPICFASSNPSVAGLGLKNYLQSEGMLVKFTPTGAPDLNGLEAINTDKLYSLVMNYDFGKIKENNILLDEHTLLSFNGSMKPAIANLALYYATKNQTDTVNKLLDHLYNNIPVTKIPYNYVDLSALQAATIAKNQKYTKAISEGIFNNTTATLDWITNPSNAKNAKLLQEELRYNLSALNSMMEIMSRSGDSTMTNKVQQKMNQYNMVLN